jgi:hypothetical protein
MGQTLISQQQISLLNSAKLSFQQCGMMAATWAYNPIYQALQRCKDGAVAAQEVAKAICADGSEETVLTPETQ